jgi:nucleoside-diphosphate-sugar epimerase
MYSLIRQIDSGFFLQVGPGTNVKSLSYVENLVDFTLWAWPRPHGEISTYNWVESPDRSSREIVKTLTALLGKRMLPLTLPLPLAEALAGLVALAFRAIGATTAISPARVRKLAAEQTFFSASRARLDGFRPRVGLDEALARTVEWYRSVGQHETVLRRLPPKEVWRGTEVAA